MQKHQKSWETPQLIILARGTPEESVLTHCKRIGAGSGTGTPQDIGQDGCDTLQTNNNCGACQARSGS
jgi:hypothetical protein